MDRSVLLVDDHAGFRAEARVTLAAGGYEVIGEAATAAAAVREAARLRPAIVLLDIGLPDGTGLDVVEPLRAAAPAAAIVLISSRRASDYGLRVGRSGALGFIDKAELSADRLGEILAAASP